MRKKKENNMENYSKSEILQMVEEEDVEFIRLQFTDMFGIKKCGNPEQQTDQSYGKPLYHRYRIPGWIYRWGRM